MSERIPVAVFFGGVSNEHEISCLTAANVLAALDADRYDVQGVGIAKDGTWWRYGPGAMARLGASTPGALPQGEAGSDRAVLVRDGERVVLASQHGDRLDDPITIEVAFPLLHGPYGEDGTIQGFFEMLGLPYVGSGVAASAVGMDKHLMKIVFAAAGLAVAPYIVLRATESGDARERVARAGLRYPVFVKPARGGSSVGISRLGTAEGLPDAVAEAGRWDPLVIVEQGVVGAREIECAVLGPAAGETAPRASRPGEIVMHAPDEFYDYEAKYLSPDRAGLVAPADLPPQVAEAFQRAAVTAFEAIGAEGLSRVDGFVLPDGQVVLNEINTMPGFTEISMFPRLWQAAGMTYPALVDDLIDQARRRGHGLR